MQYSKYIIVLLYVVIYLIYVYLIIVESDKRFYRYLS